ncbi:hypothetical protein Val02_15260 [Virgisporangium aliadipatigenens]|uniref:Ricin B lectin domain-containing protein n=1 Tax=Virgisporangium aliadipatigenens TaxID=741659 RepID=A0A8J3YIM4_9ACTN|nr:ricin-type beta-trefoil lectin domain protein [Virgisporangium aliadipatigenens]GIJ44640.1 hypothetical protein Val02_15260 [Virgisporangium aliadipatigenens]
MFAVAVAAITVAAALTAATPQAADAAPIPVRIGKQSAAPTQWGGCFTWCAFRNRATKKCLDDSFRAGLRTFPCNGTDHQRWRYDFTGYLVNQNTGRCIDDSIQHGLRAFPCNGSVYQRWVLNFNNRLPAMTYIHFGSQSTGRFMDDSFPYGLRAFPRNTSDYQLFWAH